MLFVNGFRFPFSFFGWLRQRRWGEAFVYSFILFGSLSFLGIQLTTWAIPQLNLYQEFAPVSGTVLETRIESEERDGLTVYRPEVRIEYTVGGNKHELWTFDIKTLQGRGGFVSQRKNAEKAIAPYVVGKERRCWYFLEDPTKGIVQWTIPIWGWFFLALSCCLAVLGTVGLARSLRQDYLSDERRVAQRTSKNVSPLQWLGESVKRSKCPTVPDIKAISESPGTHLALRLPTDSQPLFPLIGLTLFGLAWNIVAWSVMVHSFFNPVEHWSDHVFGIILRAVFCGVGIILFAAVIHQVLLAFGFRPTVLEISDHPIYPGRRYRMLLLQSGVIRFQELTIAVVCEEIARFHQGTDTITSRKEVFRQTLFSRTDFETTADAPLEQEFFLQLPLGAMHSFRQENNEILWKIDVFAKLVGWNEIRRECPIVVDPLMHNDLTMEGGGL